MVMNEGRLQSTSLTNCRVARSVKCPNLCRRLNRPSVRPSVRRVGGQDVVVLSACGPTLNVVIYARRQVAPLSFTNNEAATVARLRERHYATAGEDYPRI